MFAQVDSATSAKRRHLEAEAAGARPAAATVPPYAALAAGMLGSGAATEQLSLQQLLIGNPAALLHATGAGLAAMPAMLPAAFSGFAGYPGYGGLDALLAGQVRPASSYTHFPVFTLKL